MSIPRPSLYLNFAQAPGILDPRAVFTRASTGTTIDRVGLLRTVPASAPRWTSQPITGVPQGVLVEGPRTNLALQSEAFGTTWTATSCTVTSNTAAAPDGATTADTITVSGASGSCNQGIAITAGNAITLSVHLKRLASSLGRLRITDGTNAVAAWFNLAAGTVGTASAGGATVVYAAHAMEALANGWYRCQLTVTTATSTSFFIHVSAAATDNVEPANGDNVYAWGAQAEAPGGTSAASSYIATTTATVTRSGDSLVVPVSANWFNTAEGTLLVEWAGRTTGLGGQVFAAVNNGFNEIIYLTRPNATQLQFQVGSGGSGQVTSLKSYTMVDGAISRAAMAWKVNDFAWSLNGDVPGTDSSGIVPTGIARIGIGCGWGSPAGAQSFVPIRLAAYWPYRLSNAALQTISQ